MAVRTGSATLPLHGGRVPEWLAQRMARLGRVMVEALALEHGRDEVLRRLANPFWFQSLGCVMGMDSALVGDHHQRAGAPSSTTGIVPAARGRASSVCRSAGAEKNRRKTEQIRALRPRDRSAIVASPLPCFPWSAPRLRARRRSPHGWKFAPREKYPSTC